MVVMALAPSTPASVFIPMRCPAQFSPAWDGMGWEEAVCTKSWVSHALLAWQEHSPRPPSQQHPHHPLDQNHFSNDRACVCAVPTTSVQRHTSQWTSPVWHYPEKRNCAFLHWTPGQRGVGSSSWLKIFTFPKRWQSTSTARFWAQGQKVRQTGKMILVGQRHFPGEDKNNHHPSSHILNNHCIVVRGKWALAHRLCICFCFFFFFFCPLQQSHSPSSRQCTKPGMLLSSKLQSTGRSMYLGYLWAVFPKGQHTACSPDPMGALTAFKVHLQTMREWVLFLRRALGQREILHNHHRSLFPSYWRIALSKW